jgi:hypothetical protein
MVPTLLGWSRTNGSGKRKAAVWGCQFPGKPRCSDSHACGEVAFNGKLVGVISRSGARSQRMETSWSIESRGKSPSTTAVTTSWFSVIAPL